MSPAPSWYTLEKAVEKYCLETALILQWVDQGVIRAEDPHTRSMMVMANDLDQMMLHMKKRKQAFMDCD